MDAAAALERAEALATDIVTRAKGLSHVSSDEPDVVVLLGKTGAGKTTLIHLLGNSAMTAAKVRGALSLVVTDAHASLEGFEVGGSLASATEVPHKWVARMCCCPADESVWDPSGDEADSADGDAVVATPSAVQRKELSEAVFWDCPGFADNRGAGVTLSNAMYVQKVLDTAQRVKVVVVLTDLCILERRAEELLLVADQVAGVFLGGVGEGEGDGPDTLTALAGCIAVVLTGTPPEREAADLCETLDAILDDPFISLSHSQRRVLRVLRAAPVALFPKPAKAGALASGYLRRTRGSIARLIFGRAAYTDGPVSASVALPAAARSTLQDAERVVAARIRRAVFALRGAVSLGAEEFVKALCPLTYPSQRVAFEAAWTRVLDTLRRRGDAADVGNALADIVRVCTDLIVAFEELRGTLAPVPSASASAGRCVPQAADTPPLLTADQFEDAARLSTRVEVSAFLRRFAVTVGVPLLPPVDGDVEEEVLGGEGGGFEREGTSLEALLADPSGVELWAALDAAERVVEHKVGVCTGLCGGPCGGAAAALLTPSSGPASLPLQRAAAVLLAAAAEPLHNMHMSSSSGMSAVSAPDAFDDDAASREESDADESTRGSGGGGGGGGKGGGGGVEDLFNFQAMGLSGERWKACAACSAASSITVAAAVAAYASPDSADAILNTYITFLTKFLGAAA